MENKLEIDLCVMDSIIMTRALNRERLALLELIKFQKYSEDDYNMFINQKRLVRVCCLLDKVKESLSKISQEEINDNYFDDKLSI